MLETETTLEREATETKETRRFSARRDPHIFSADGFGNCTSRDKVGYHAIGAGAARAWLVANDYLRRAATPSTDWPEAGTAALAKQSQPFEKCAVFALRIPKYPF